MLKAVDNVRFGLDNRPKRREAMYFMWQSSSTGGHISFFHFPQGYQGFVITRNATKPSGEIRGGQFM